MAPQTARGQSRRPGGLAGQPQATGTKEGCLEAWLTQPEGISREGRQAWGAGAYAVELPLQKGRAGKKRLGLPSSGFGAGLPPSTWLLPGPPASSWSQGVWAWARPLSCSALPIAATQFKWSCALFLPCGRWAAAMNQHLPESAQGAGADVFSMAGRTANAGELGAL